MAYEGLRWLTVGRGAGRGAAMSKRKGKSRGKQKTPSDLPLVKVTIQFYAEDVERAKERARALALPYQVYLRSIVHTAMAAREEVKLK